MFRNSTKYRYNSIITGTSLSLSSMILFMSGIGLFFGMAIKDCILYAKNYSDIISCNPANVKQLN